MVGSELDAQSALDGARAAGDRRAELRALNALGYVARESNVAASVVHHESALTIARELGDVAAEVAILNRLSLQRTVLLEIHRGLDAGERALKLARQSGDPALLSLALDALKLAALWLGDLDRLQQLTSELLELIGADRPWYRGFAVMESAFVPLARREWATAEARLQTAGELARRAGSSGLASLVGEVRSWLLRGQGRLEEAVAEARWSLETVLSSGARQFIGWFSATLATALLESGQADEAVSVLETGLGEASRAQARGEMLRCAGQLALARSRMGLMDEAVAAADETERLLSESRLPVGATVMICAHGTLGAARARLAAGDLEAARSLAAPVQTAAELAGWYEFAESAADVLAGAGDQSGQKTS